MNTTNKNKKKMQQQNGVTVLLSFSSPLYLCVSQYRVYHDFYRHTVNLWLFNDTTN